MMLSHCSETPSPPLALLRTSFDRLRANGARGKGPGKPVRIEPFNKLRAGSGGHPGLYIETYEDAFLTYQYWLCLPCGMWWIEEHQRVEKQLDTVPQEILKRYEKWKDIAKLSGPPGLILIKGFHDEALRGEWQGYRSSSAIENDRVRLGVERAKILARALKCHPAVLVFPGWEGTQETAA